MAVMTKAEFIKEVARCVQKYAYKYGILVHSPIIAQACLESGYGTSKKATMYNNILGLKYRQNRVTSNNGYFEDDGSEQNADGTYTNLPSTTAWYRFDSIEKCIEGYFQFINISNYAALKGEKDPYQYLVKIKAAGYATSLNYVNNVYSYITKNNLTKYDPVDTADYRVAIDAGHGSNTGGKRHPDGYREHYSNVYISYYLHQILNKNGIDTLKISWDDDNAHDDTDVALGTRQSQIKSWGADISISIHANAHGDGTSYTSANGIETFWHSIDSKTGTDSQKLANSIHNQIIKGTKQLNRGVKRANFAMCNCANMGTKASILIETAFMTNEYESALLKSDSYCKETAKEIAQGVFDYFGINGNVNVSLNTVDNIADTNDKNPVLSKPIIGAITSPDFDAGDKFTFKNVEFFTSSAATISSSKKTGTFYVWSDQVINGKVRMTNALNKVGNSSQITGWVDEDILLDIIKSNSNNSTNIVTISKNITSGESFKLTNVPFYGSSVIKTSGNKKTGTFYVWSNEVINGRVRMTNSKARVGIAGQITGWVDESVLINIKNTPVVSTKPTTTNGKINTSSIKISGNKYLYENIDYSPVFDPVYYANKYPDVVKEHGRVAPKLFLHFLQFGMNESRIASVNFNVTNYKNRYIDLRKAFGNNLPEYYKHYIQFGIKERRNGK